MRKSSWTMRRDSPLSRDGKKMLVRSGANAYIVGTTPAQKLDKPLSTAGMSLTVDPLAEWHQMFNDAWRIERDYFYDPGMHGVDWNLMKKRYGSLIDDAVSRWDVTFVLGELIGELSSSHTYVQGGQTEVGPRRGVGLLGADYTLEKRRVPHREDHRRWRVGQRGALAAAAGRRRTSTRATTSSP